MLLEVFLLLMVAAAGALYLARFVKNPYVLFVFSAILILVSGIGAISGLDIISGETVDYGSGFTASTTQTYTTTINRSTMSNIPTNILGTCLFGFAFYLLIVTPFVKPEGAEEDG